MKAKMMKAAAKAALVLREKKPEILLGLGLVGFAGTVVLTVQAKKKVDKTISKFEDLQKELPDYDVTSELPVELPKELRREMALEIALDVIPPVAAGVASVACIMTSYGIMNRRLTVVGTALAATTKSFSEYRQRVRKEIGEQKEAELYRNNAKKTIVHENGVEEVVDCFESDCVDGRYLFPFNKETSYKFETGNGADECNRLFLMSVENNLNRQLQRDGYVFLNTALKALGMKPIAIGQYMGWGTDTGYIDLGVFKHAPAEYYEDKTQSQFLAESVLLDLNIEGRVDMLM